MTVQMESRGPHYQRAATGRPNRFVTDHDRLRSRTAFTLDELRRAAEPLRSTPVKRLLDVRSDFGGLSPAVGPYVGCL